MCPDGDIYIGGQFTTVGGVAVRNLAKVDEVTGANVAAFTQHPAGRVNHVEVVIDQGNVQHLLIGWNSAPFLRSVNPITGVDDSYVQNVPVSGTYQFTGVSANTTRIWNMSVYPAPYQPGSTTVNPAVLMTGIFTSVGGQHHEQVFRLNLTPTRATVSAWSPRELYNHCIGRQPFWAQDAAWAPDMSAIYVVTPASTCGTSSGRPTASGAGGPARATRRSRTRSRRPNSARPAAPARPPGTTGSTTPGATRCTRSPRTRRRCSSVVTSGGSTTPRL